MSRDSRETPPFTSQGTRASRASPDSISWSDSCEIHRAGRASCCVVLPRWTPGDLRWRTWADLPPEGCQQLFLNPSSEVPIPATWAELGPPSLIANRQAKLMGGVPNVESIPGDGSLFHLPQCSCRGPGCKMRMHMNPIERFTDCRGGCQVRVLLVDDIAELIDPVEHADHDRVLFTRGGRNASRRGSACARRAPTSAFMDM